MLTATAEAPATPAFHEQPPETTPAAIIHIPLDHITPSRTNPRKFIDKDALASLAASIKEHGVLEPIIVREIAGEADGEAARYEIIAGERRYRASRKARLAAIPAIVRTVSDTATREIQIIENLQREDLHPLDEATGFRKLMESANMSAAEIAARVAKPASYVARRVALTGLIKEAKEDFKANLITLAHALEICRLAPDVQPAALAACYEKTHVLNTETREYEPVANKEVPAKTVRSLQDWLARNVRLNLQTAPFRTDDTRLRADRLACVDCPQRTGFDRNLFADIQGDDTCLNPTCFAGKVQTLIQITRDELSTKSDTPAALITPYYGGATGDVLARDGYQPLEKKSDRCQHAERAVYAAGEKTGQVQWICRERTCKDHLGRVYGSRERAALSEAGASGGDYERSARDERNRRKQELFDVKVAETARKRVMHEALKTFKYPFERAHLNEAAAAHFERIPAFHQRTIMEVLGWEQGENLMRQPDKLRRELGKLDNRGIAQFIMLCSFAHYGANEYGHYAVDQGQVTKLAKDRSVNYALIDAQVRLELSPKKYAAEHQQHFDLLTAGKKSKRPVVYEQAANEPTVAAAAEAKKPHPQVDEESATGAQESAEIEDDEVAEAA